MKPSPVPSVLAGFEATALAAARGVTLADFLRIAVDCVAKMLGAEHCSLLLVDGGVLRRGAEIGLPEDFVVAIDGIERSDGHGTCGTAAFFGRPVITEDIETDPDWDAYRELARAAGLRACWSVPVRRPDGPVLGTFATYSRAPLAPSASQVHLAESYATMVALGLEFLRQQSGVAKSYESVVRALSGALDARDEYTAQHSTETGELARAVGGRLGLERPELERLTLVARLHDIGKLGIPTDILVRPGPLGGDEWGLMRQHPVIGERILRPVPDFADVATAVRHEHERWDGGGYPDGLAGEQIPLLSRIVFACDAYHAMTSDRPYRRALALEAACGELRTNAGGQFDPRVAQALLEILGEEGSSPVAPTLAEQDSERVRTLRRLAADVGAEDLLVFRRVAPDVFCHLGGAGRGETWAGNIDLHPSSERHLVEALERGAPVVADPGRMGRVVGPYHARTAVVVPAADDLVVVFGSASESLHDASSERAQAVAEQATRLIDRVSPAKRLADELEVLDAVRAVATLAADDVPGTLAACAERAAAALSCEWAALGLLPSDGREALVGASGTGWSPPGPGSVEALVGSLAARIDELPLLIQDTSDEEGLAPGFRAEDGACSLHAIAVGEPPLGILVAVHATPGLRGFTALCQRVAHGVGDTAEPVVRRALAQERLTAENAALRRALRVDGMTGVTSRAGWEEAFHVEERRGGAVSVVVVDLDGLKAVNDRDGHAAGDALLRSCAGVLREISRPIDLVARLGGDEFGVLLRGVGEAQAADWSARLRERLACAGIPASLGVASSPPCPSPLAAVDVADRRMYEAKTAARPAPAGLA